MLTSLVLEIHEALVRNLKKYSLDYRASRGNQKVSSGVLGRWFGLLFDEGTRVAFPVSLES